jgi:Holliday junction resolvasome RuvABC endonuclease subunit
MTVCNDCVVGIDPSFTGFAMAAIYRDGRTVSHEFKTDAVKTLRARMSRLRYYGNEAASFLRHHLPEVCLIEGYAHAAKWKAAPMGELGAIVRDRIIDLPDVCLEIAPSTLKQFIAGKGNASKLEIVQKMAKLFDREFKTDNLADAYGLALLGTVVLGYREATTQRQRAVLNVVRNQMQQELESE